MQRSYNSRTSSYKKVQLSTRYTEKPYAAAKYLLKRLIGYVKSDVIESHFKTVLTLVDDEVVQGAYINSDEDYILLTTKSIFWQSTKNGGKHYPYTEIDALSLEHKEKHLALQITMRNQTLISIPLMNDHLEAFPGSYQSIYEDIPDDLEELVKLHIEPLNKFPEICAWVLDGNPKPATQKKLGISKYDTSRCFALYTALMELADIIDSEGPPYMASGPIEQISSGKEHQPGIYYLRGLSSFASRQDFLEQGRSPDEFPPGLLGIYVNNETSYLIVESDKLVDCKLGAMVGLPYDKIASVVEDSPGCIGLDLKDGTSYLIPVENYTEDLPDLDYFLEFLEFKVHKPALTEIEDLSDLQLFLRHLSDRFPEYAKLATVLPEFAPSASGQGKNHFTGFYRLLALLLTEPYSH